MIYYVLSFLLGAVLGRATRRSTVQYAVVPVIAALPRSVALATSWRNKHGHVRYLPDEEAN